MPIGREQAVDLLNADSTLVHGELDSRVANDQAVLEGSLCGLTPGIHREADRTQLHLGNGVVTVAPAGRRGETGHVA